MSLFTLTCTSHLLHDYQTADLDSQTRGILDFATKLTREPAKMKESDVQELRSLGLDDAQILSVVGVTCLFNFMNRLADGLGVDIPAERQESMSRWVTGPARDLEWLWVETN